MKKIKKIKIKLNGKTIIVNNNLIIDRFLKKLRIPIKKVAIELNNEILDKKKLEKIVFKIEEKFKKKINVGVCHPGSINTDGFVFNSNNSPLC